MFEFEGDGSLRYMAEDLYDRRPDRGIHNLSPVDVLEAYGIEPRGIIHVGAHMGEEVPMYRELGFDQIYLIEPGMEASRVLSGKFSADQDVTLWLGTAIHDGPTQTVKLGSDGRTLGTYAGGDGELVSALPLRQLQSEMLRAGLLAPNVLVVDTQGSELDVIKSADLSVIDMIIVETRDPGTDAPAADFHGVCPWLAPEFAPVERWRHGQHAYADVVFVRLIS